MNETFIRDRITALRLKKGISEYKMSTDLGHSKSYIQSISSGRSLPSWGEFFSICEYLDITPELFFSAENQNPAPFGQILEGIKTMPEADLQLLLNLVNRLNRRP